MTHKCISVEKSKSKSEVSLSRQTNFINSTVATKNLRSKICNSLPYVKWGNRFYLETQPTTLVPKLRSGSFLFEDTRAKEVDYKTITFFKFVYVFIPGKNIDK